MKFPKTLDELENQLDSIVLATDLFNGDIDGVLKKLLAFCHPDRHGMSDQSERLFIRIQTLAEEARAPLVTLKSPKRLYTLCGRRFVGDISDLYLATAESKEYLVKISRVPGAEKLLDRERQVLTELHTDAQDAKYRCYFPLIVESFPARDKFKKRVNVFAHEDGWYSLEQVMAKYLNGLSGRHIIWIFKRLLTALGFARKNGIVHGAILPCHVLVRPKDHALRVVGWGQSANSGDVIKSVPSAFINSYPKELKEKKPAKSGADIVMAAITIGCLADKKIPKALDKYIAGCDIPGQWCRDIDGWDLYDELTVLAKEVYGKSKFVSLEM